MPVNTTQRLLLFNSHCEADNCPISDNLTSPFSTNDAHHAHIYKGALLGCRLFRRITLNNERQQRNLIRVFADGCNDALPIRAPRAQKKYNGNENNQKVLLFCFFL